MSPAPKMNPTPGRADKRAAECKTVWSALTANEIAELAAEHRIAVLPVGATEQHGPHLATGTDWVLAQAAVEAACATTGDVALPPLSIGCSLGHTSQWAGTLSLSPATMSAVVYEIGKWVYASGFRRLVLVNGHATNGPPCQSALLQLRFDIPDLLARFVTMFDLTEEIHAAYYADADDFHANAAETSLMLHLDDRSVDMKNAVDEPDRTIGKVFPYAMPSVTQSGVVGAPTQATVDSGERLFNAVVDAIAELLSAARGEHVDLDA